MQARYCVSGTVDCQQQQPPKLRCDGKYTPSGEHMPVSRRLQARENRLYISPKTRISGFGDYFQIPAEGKTMNRRLYFLLPDRAHALSVVNELA
jgi:hypothetical protein